MNRLQLAIEQIVFARNYTLGLLGETPPQDWYRQLPGVVSHVAWQVGHIAFAQYRLALFRIRGERPEDAAMFPKDFMKRFGANSVPDFAPENQMDPADIRTTMDRVHNQVMQELPLLKEEDLDQPVPHPHPFAKTKFLALMWCANHELVHAGQIGLLRRLLGYAPMW